MHKVEQLGCWVGEVSAAERADRVAKMQSTGLAPGFVPVRLKLGASEAGQGDDLKETHGFLARFDKDLSAQTGLIEQARHIAAAGLSKHDAVPEDQVFCIDHTLYRPEHPTKNREPTSKTSPSSENSPTSAGPSWTTTTSRSASASVAGTRS